MAEFKMMTRPKKPEQPATIRYGVGNYVTMGYMLECIEQFKSENPDRSDREIMVAVDENWYGENQITLVLLSEGDRSYQEKLEKYKENYKEYKAWQAKHPKEIKKHKAAAKKATAKRKLQRTEERLAKELEVVKAKLERDND